MARLTSLYTQNKLFAVLSQPAENSCFRRTDQPTDRRTDGRTDGRKDGQTLYTDARMHLERKSLDDFGELILKL